MNDIEMRKKGIGQRIQNERKKKNLSQEQFAGEIEKILGCEAIAQNTISNWEKGKTVPTLERIIAMSKIFGCDCGYLLCDYDDPVHNQSSIASTTGLSFDSIQHLCSEKHWGITENAKVIDFLLLDARKRDAKHHHRSILDLLNFYLRYENTSEQRKQVFTNGNIVDFPDNDGFISVNSIALTSTIIENAVLMEIEQALHSLKRLVKVAKKG